MSRSLGTFFAIGKAVVKGPDVASDANPMALPEDGPPLAPRDRASYWRFISGIGDTRPGVGVRSDGVPDIVWCDVPAGEFRYGDKKEKRTLPAFRIGKYLVTYRQFQAFIDAPDGYKNRAWWDELHPDGLARQQHGPAEQRFKYDNHPRENVSWYEAMAFRNWLSDKLGYVVTLPTVEQWEKAARGTDGRVYPYGHKFDPEKCNVWQSGIGQTSAVGAFPAGASPYGALDMSGNVWEWTLTEYRSGNSNDPGSNVRRGMRGGSGVDGRARAAARNHFDGGPGYGGPHIGFRLASPALQ
jgi:formylglycine-generating enzyme required for sulfatase activity